MRQKRKEAAQLREAYGLCLCENGDEVKTYNSDVEAAADISPPITCPNCGRERLRVQAIHTPGYPSVSKQLARLR